MKKIRCAIYTRKSSEDGLEQEFNSLDAQREACAAYIQSQKAEGWVLLEEPYDDGGLSGGTMERPALRRLLADIDAGRIDQIVVYKIDRLTRSLSDFAKIVDILDASGASFVSVTQSFNTATSMGRLTLNMLLSFAQFEREVTAERIRDKIAASKKKGLWMGGNVPLGYDADGRTLSINTLEAQTVQTLYDLYRQHLIIRLVKKDADSRGLVTKRRIAPDGTRSGGRPFSRGHIWQVLTNPIYAGRIRHKGQVYEGLHDAIIPATEWDAPFRLRKRGVETKIILNGKARPIDDVLIANIALAHTWFEWIKAGQTASEIARSTGTSKRRVQQVLDLAFLAPDIVRDVLSGHQPIGLTSDWCLRHTLPPDWNEQRKLVATL